MKNGMYLVLALLLCLIAVGGIAVLMQGDNSSTGGNNSGYDTPYDSGGSNGGDSGGNSGGVSMNGITLNETSLIF